jgi:hypothetical protein
LAHQAREPKKSQEPFRNQFGDEGVMKQYGRNLPKASLGAHGCSCEKQIASLFWE